MLGWLIGIAAGLFALWLVLIVALAIVRPRGASFTDAVRLLPDLLRMLTRLARDADATGPSRWAARGLLLYLAFPIDLVPDFIPVIGYGDDVVAVVLVLRFVVRRAGAEALTRNWTGGDPGLATIQSLAGSERAARRRASQVDSSANGDGSVGG